MTMAPPSSGTHTVLNASHWGAFYARVQDGCVVQARPFLERLPAPAEKMIQAIPACLYSENRVKYPMVRADYLKKGSAGDTSERGRGNFRQGWMGRGARPCCQGTRACKERVRRAKHLRRELRMVQRRQAA